MGSRNWKSDFKLRLLRIRNSLIMSAHGNTTALPCQHFAASVYLIQYKIKLQFSGSDTGNFVVKQTVVDSSSGDYNKGYVYPTLTGQILRGSIGPVADTTQTIAFTIANAPAWAFSQPVNLTVGATFQRFGNDEFCIILFIVLLPFLRIPDCRSLIFYLLSEPGVRNTVFWSGLYGKLVLWSGYRNQ